MQLLIVESPTKAKTLMRFLPKEYKALATMGHVMDLPKSKLGVDVDNKFEPDFQSVEKKKDTVEKIVRDAKKAKTSYIATDPDREGEAIADHIRQFLVKKKVKPKRIVFHEITKSAVESAIKSPGSVNDKLVDAQAARRVLDRLVGYKLSPLLWKKVRRGLSAGRVQSVALRLIVEREEEIKGFKSKKYWEVYVDVKPKDKNEFEVLLIKVDDKKAVIEDEKLASKVANELEKSSYKVDELKKSEVAQNPYPPFTTSTMTQAAARLFSWSAKKTMSVAQGLYEEGLITYHRTDSLNVSPTAIDKARKYILKTYGEKYVPEKPKYYKTKAKVAQEAHEAIRPTGMDSKPSFASKRFVKEKARLYELIFKRFVASQMTKSVSDKTVIDVLASAKNTSKYLLRAVGQVMKFDGWRACWGKKQDDAIILPEVEKNEALKKQKVRPLEKETLPPPRYNEASLIKTLEKLGIGRPSTYAPIISTIQARNYVLKEEGKFLPTNVGFAVNGFLTNNFEKIMDYEFTANMENNLDKVAKGELDWKKMMSEFYSPFEKKLETVEKKAERVKIETEKLGKKCPRCNKGELVVRIGRFGKFVSCSRFPDCNYTDKYLEKIGMKCPGCKKGEVIVKKTKKSRKFFGCSLYPECKWASWQKPKKNEKAK